MIPHEADVDRAVDKCLAAPCLEQARAGALDPAISKAIVKVAPYLAMACGDKLVLCWVGLDAEGAEYRHEVSRFVSEGQVGKDIIFAVAGEHIEALDGGSVKISYTLSSMSLPSSADSLLLQLNVGDPRSQLLPVVVNGAVGGTLDPDRVVEGVCVAIRPYARMAAGDRIVLSWKGVTAQTTFSDRLNIETFAVGQTLSFWVRPEFIAPSLGSAVTISYRVEQCGQLPRDSEPAQLSIGRLVRGPLLAPVVLEADEGWLDLPDSIDGVTVVIDNARTEEGELVYLKCNGTHFSHRDEREISRGMAGEPLVFIVPYRFWREHQDTTVRVFYSVERLDGVSQESEVMLVQVHS
ncbi:MULTISPECIES: hypothetical protein [unclassified Pseudomonas]|uniref:hypothetical protein n=1 Tax=unclassified Pseudomonas TaxID=196821 RepID=UPI002AC910FE|nr:MULTISPECIES: hypothetical protein [unclassified Pseudomonas]MEB0046668.1 hypothetical protein [Pseudomonas sp. Dout3]MEB0098550.1 hypothetical protein [Pseudomonas sp. DC1.2]WPX56675.1 hypothetical protein RHM68_13470 [Pseudomonas sp. DC1.2]